MRPREEGWRGREDPRTRGEDEFLGEGRAPVAVWPETQKVIRMALSSQIHMRWLLEQQTPPKSCFNPGPLTSCPQNSLEVRCPLQSRSGTRAPVPLSVLVRLGQREGRGPRVGHGGGALPDQSWKRHPNLTSLRYILRTRFAHFRCTIQCFLVTSEPFHHPPTPPPHEISCAIYCFHCIRNS